MLIKDATKVTKDLLSHLQDPEFNDIKIRGGGAVQQDYPPYESKGSTPFAQYYDQKEQLSKWWECSGNIRVDFLLVG